ncbi:MAG TPA: DUF3189 family protein [Verrucomicrobiae bacterium]|nr:DUF3189 family protein [Verrucomicrobiae bacterium]
MKIIYNCYGGSHSSVTAAAIHLGLLDCGNVPCARELWELPYYDSQVKKDHGTLHFMGTDEFNNRIFVVGRRNMGKPVKRALAGLAHFYGIPEQDFRLVDPMPYVNWAMVVGGFTSRRLGLIPLGRPVVTWGTRLAFPKLSELVAGVKKDLTPALPVDFQPRQVKAVVYCDYTGNQQAGVAAALHLGTDPHALLPRFPVGTLVHHGEDAQGRHVFTLGVSYENELLPKIMREFAKLYGIPATDLSIVDLTGIGKIAFGFGALMEYVPGLRGFRNAVNKLLVGTRLPQIVDAVKKVRASQARM